VRKLFLLILLTATALLAGACTLVISGDGLTIEHYKGTWEETYAFSSGAVTVQGGNGSITVETWDKEEVLVQAHWTARTESYQFAPLVEQEGDSLSFAAPWNNELRGVTWILKVPPGLSVTARTSNGRVNILGGEFGNVTVETSNGRVTVEGSGKGMLTINTSNGGVTVREWNGETDITTSNGAITAFLGKITDGNYRLSSSNGTLRVFVDRDSAFALTASTSNGRINSDLTGAWSQMPTGSSYTGTYNGGGALLNLHTSNSSIFLLTQ